MTKREKLDKAHSKLIEQYIHKMNTYYEGGL
jgi:hypothetical protein